MNIYTYRNCGTCKKATKWLDANGIAYNELPIRDTPPSKAELQEMLEYQEGNLKALFNTAGGDYRELNLKDCIGSMSVSEAFDLLANRGNLVKRPFLLSDDIGLVGFKEATWEQLLKK